MKEEKLVPLGKLISYEQKVIPGPASAVCVAGYFQALEKNLIKDGETVIVNIGEGPNRAPLFLEQMIYTTCEVESVEQCKPHEINGFREELWKEVAPILDSYHDPMGDFYCDNVRLLCNENIIWSNLTLL